MRYLDIIRNREKEHHRRSQIVTPYHTSRSADAAACHQSEGDELNELNEKRAGAFPPGTWVEWDSPLYGQCSGLVAMPPEQGWLVVRIPGVPSHLVFIPLDSNVHRLSGGRLG